MKKAAYVSQIMKKFNRDYNNLLRAIDHRTVEGKDVEDAFYVPPHVIDDQGTRVWSFR